MLNPSGMNWLNIEAAPFDRDLEVAVIDSEGAHAVVFPCRRILGGWVNAATRAPVKIHPTHTGGIGTQPRRPSLASPPRGARSVPRNKAPAFVTPCGALPASTLGVLVVSSILIQFLEI